VRYFADFLYFRLHYLPFPARGHSIVQLNIKHAMKSLKSKGKQPPAFLNGAQIDNVQLRAFSRTRLVGMRRSLMLSQPILSTLMQVFTVMV
jgi:hypothetical protein